LPATDIEELAFARKGTLGRYFEMLVGTLFSISPEIECTYKNVIVRDGKKTVGEFDLLYKKDGHWHHLELAIKFYLGTSDQTSDFNWYGPALRDTLGRKLARINDHQLKLHQSDAASIVLQKLSINDLNSESLMLGRLFYPFKDWILKSLISSLNISRYHSNGWWMSSSEVITLSKTSHILYLPLMKHDWIGKAEMLSPQLRLNFKDIKHPKMVAVFEQRDQNKFYETQRGFIVPDDWGPK